MRHRAIAHASSHLADGCKFFLSFNSKKKKEKRKKKKKGQ